MKYTADSTEIDFRAQIKILLRRLEIMYRDLNKRQMNLKYMVGIMKELAKPYSTLLFLVVLQTSLKFMYWQRL